MQYDVNEGRVEPGHLTAHPSSSKLSCDPCYDSDPPLLTLLPFVPFLPHTISAQDPQTESPTPRIAIFIFVAI